MSKSSRINWLNSMRWQIDFYRRSGRATRKDPEFEWDVYEHSPSGRLPETRRMVKTLLHRLGLRSQAPLSMSWMRDHGDKLWETRCMLADDLSRLLFDSSLIVRLSNHRKFYYPRIDFDDLIELIRNEPFSAAGYPHDYLGVPLRIFEARLANRGQPFNVITRAIQLRLVNSYRQYLIRREGTDLSPVRGDIVYDCGACIGEISVLFAAMVAPVGEVHLFDPIPLHARFCRLQGDLNPDLCDLLHINTLAVGDRTHEILSPRKDADKITPGAISTDAFPCTRLDDYAAANGGRVDFIKMDIEGSELGALDGGAGVIEDQKPRLAISGYHKPEDLWELPRRILEINPGYKLTFGHHTPIGWESVFYAVDRNKFR